MNSAKQPEGNRTSVVRNQWWAGVQMTLATIARLAPAYLPDDGEDLSEALDPKAVEEVQNVLLQARSAADMAAGAYARVVRMEHELREREGMAAGTPSLPDRAGAGPGSAGLR